MRKLLLPVFGLLCTATLAQAELVSEKQPIEITATGNTNYQNGLATAHGNVAIHTGDSDSWFGDAEPVDQGFLEQLQRLEDRADVELVPEAH